MNTQHEVIKLENLQETFQTIGKEFIDLDSFKDPKTRQIVKDVQKMNEGIQEFIRLSIKTVV